MTPLYVACEYGNLPVVQYFCEVQKVNTKDALRYACSEGNLEVVKYLCEVQKVNTKGAYKWCYSEDIRKYLESIGIHN